MKICAHCGTVQLDTVAKCGACGSGAFLNVCPNCGAKFSGNYCPNCGVRANAQPKRCPRCNRTYFSNACPDCGYKFGDSTTGRVPAAPAASTRSAGGSSLDGFTVCSPKRKVTTALLCLFLGLFGVHRFYVGKVGTGFLWLFTLGLCGIGWFIDLTAILAGGFTDKDKLPIRM